jgi:hypothetical protein
LRRGRKAGRNSEELTMNNRIIYVFIIFLIVMCFAGNVIAYDDEVTHPEITLNAIAKSKIEQYLIRNLGFQSGFKRQNGDSAPFFSASFVVFLLSMS